MSWRDDPVTIRGMERTRIVIADDHAMFRDGIRMLIERDPSFEIVGEAADTRTAVWAVTTLKPTMLVLDLSMPEGRVVPAIASILADAPALRIVVLTMHDDPAYLRASFAAGAVGYVLKRSSPSVLVHALHAVRTGRMYVDPAFPAEPVAARPQSPLSQRELEVLALLARGLTYRAAGARLHVSERTIETHRRNIAEKLGLHSRAELLRYALESGLVTPSSDEPRDTF